MFNADNLSTLFSSISPVGGTTRYPLKSTAPGLREIVMNAAKKSTAPGLREIAMNAEKKKHHETFGKWSER